MVHRIPVHQYCTVPTGRINSEHKIKKLTKMWQNPTIHKPQSTICHYAKQTLQSSSALL
jgi:hypothetical protein